MALAAGAASVVSAPLSVEKRQKSEVRSQRSEKRVQLAAGSKRGCGDAGNDGMMGA